MDCRFDTILKALNKDYPEVSFCISLEQWHHSSSPVQEPKYRLFATYTSGKVGDFSTRNIHHLLNLVRWLRKGSAD